MGCTCCAGNLNHINFMGSVFLIFHSFTSVPRVCTVDVYDVQFHNAFCFIFVLSECELDEM